MVMHWLAMMRMMMTLVMNRAMGLSHSKTCHGY
jgi:hypothetical protein